MIHALLRLTLLAVNVLDTFKILRSPKPRKGGTDPSARALAVRKRGMKGTLCVWIVTACWLSVESISDRTVIYLTPFYNEIKSICFMFLILSRAAGAEPILLKFIKPLLRPYIQTIDSILELLFVVAAFVLELVTVPVTLLKDRWTAFSEAAAAEKETETQEQSGQVGVSRPRRVAVFSFWRDVLRDDPEDAEEDAAAKATKESTSDSDSVDAEKPLLSKPKSPRLAPTRPPLATRNSSEASKLAVPPFAPSKASSHSSTKSSNSAKRPEPTRPVKSTNNSTEDTQEESRRWMRPRGERPAVPAKPANISRAPSEASTTRGRGKLNGSSTRADSSAASGSTSSGVPTGESPSDPTPNPFVSSPPPQQSQAFPTKPNQPHPPNPTVPSISYVAAPPLQPVSHTQHSSPQLSPGIQEPLPPFVKPASTPHPTPPSARLPAHPVTSTAQDPLANIDIDAVFSTIGSPRGPSAPEPAPMPSSRGNSGRPRPKQLDSEKLANHPAIPAEINTPLESPPSPPSQYLGRPTTTPKRAQVPGSAPAKTPLAPGGYGWFDNSQRMEKKQPKADDEDEDEEDEDEDEDEDDEDEDEDALGPEDSISVRGARRPGDPKGAVPPDTRPSTIFEFDQLKKQVEEEEAAEARAYAIALASIGVTKPQPPPAPAPLAAPPPNGALGLSADHTADAAAANASLRNSVNLPGHFPMSPGFQPKEITPLAQVPEAMQGAQARTFQRERPPSAKPSLDNLNVPRVEPVRRSPDMQYHQRNSSGAAPQPGDIKQSAEEVGGIKAFVPLGFVPPTAAPSAAGTVKPPPPASTIARTRNESRPPTVQANPRLAPKTDSSPQVGQKPPLPRPSSTTGSQRRPAQAPSSYTGGRQASGPDSIQAMTEQFVERISPPMATGSLPRSYERTAGLRSQTPAVANPSEFGAQRYQQPPPSAPPVPMKMPMPGSSSTPIPIAQPQHQRTRSDAPSRPGPNVASRRVGSTGSNSPSVSGSSEVGAQTRGTRSKTPIVAQKRSSEHLDERADPSLSRARNPTVAPNDDSNKKRRVVQQPPIAQAPATLRPRTSAQQVAREGAGSASGSSVAGAIAHNRARSGGEGMPMPMPIPMPGSRPMVAQPQAPELVQPMPVPQQPMRRPRPRAAQ